MSMTRTRPETAFAPMPEAQRGFQLKGLTKAYNHQYANMYFSRLFELSGVVKKRAHEKWNGAKGDPQLVERNLDVQQGQLCYIFGTIYMDMPLKPNVLEDINKDKWVIAPPPRARYFSDEDEILLEDESGRVRLVGERIKNVSLVTGVIIAVLGYEASAGEFEVIDICFPGVPPHWKPSFSSTVASSSKKTLDAMDVNQSKDDAAKDAGSWVAIVSGLEITGGGGVSDLQLELLVDWLTGEVNAESSGDEVALGGTISRLILAGNSLAPPTQVVDPTKTKVYGYDASTYSTLPISTLDSLLSSLTPLLPIHLLPGPSDPAAITLPQQAIPRLMFASSSRSPSFQTHTNPCWFEVGGKGFLGTGGQPIDDMFKYVEGEDRLALAKATLEWQHMAPSAPDTLWCHPFDDRDPFIMQHAPDVYFIGNQPEFATALVTNSLAEPTRLVLVPTFRETGIVVLVHTGTLECRTVELGVPTFGDDDAEADEEKRKAA